jgi:hypothetical protein
MEESHCVCHGIGWHESRDKYRQKVVRLLSGLLRDSRTPWFRSASTSSETYWSLSDNINNFPQWLPGKLLSHEDITAMASPA